jgi:hypothetical protein
MIKNILSIPFMVLVASFFVLAGCSESPQDHFKSNQSGVSADYGVFYDGNLDDHVVTVHGFWDDRSVCEEVAKTLEKMSENERSYSCRKLN